MPTYNIINNSSGGVTFQQRTLEPGENTQFTQDRTFTDADLRVWAGFNLIITPVTTSGTGSGTPAPALMPEFRIQNGILQLRFSETAAWIDAFTSTQIATSLVQTFVQPTPLQVWTINHNLGRTPQFTFFTMGGMEIDGQVQNVDNDQVTVTFDIPVMGYAKYI